MEATIVDLRYKMHEILKALFRNEVVKIFYHGKAVWTIVPKGKTKFLKVSEHPFFGLLKSSKEPVESVMESLRGGRTHDF